MDEANQFEMMHVPAADEARVNVTYDNQNGHLPDPVHVDLQEADVIRIAQEALRGGGIPGIDAAPTADLDGYRVDRYPAKDDQPNRLFVRPKTEFGA